MINLVVRRLGWAVAVAWFVATLSFVVAMALPADPAAALLGPHATEASIARVKTAYCLDGDGLERLVHAYGCWLDHLARGDLGDSYRSQRPVAEIIAERIWPTTQLALAAIALQLLLGVPLGIVAAIRRGRWPDHAAHLIGLVGQSAPPFLVGTVMLYVFAYRFAWFPLTGYGAGGWDRLAHLALPATSIATVGVALYARVLRGELIEVLGDDFVRTARAKGLPERVVVGRHALRNALGPLVSLLGIDLGVLLGGAVVTEVIFNWPGLGDELVQAVLDLDVPLILGVVLVTTLAIAVVNLVADLVHLWIDPRLRDG
jgi:peptide/nickel transport system permease protein